MWVKKSDDEIRQADAEERRTWRRWRFPFAFSASIVMGIALGALDFFLGGHFSQVRGIVPLKGPIWVDMVESSCLLFAVLCVVFLFMKKYPSRDMLCPKCGDSKSDDGNLNCSCGGKFEPMSQFKWVNDVDH
jgi:hypothetical protein